MIVAIISIVVFLSTLELLTVLWQRYQVLKQCRLFLYSKLDLRCVEITDVQIRSIHRTELKFNICCNNPFVLHPHREELEIFLCNKLNRQVLIKQIKSN